MSDVAIIVYAHIIEEYSEVIGDIMNIEISISSASSHFSQFVSNCFIHAVITQRISIEVTEGSITNG